ncbi:hypothetical protein MARU1_003604 [Malassezia arunalokei]|uniref:DUF1754-domain-containing protein n=1 Tax=Malassezia arunalokei TaxID=1514897 RepID=A0AAJ5Z3C1_9BASI|nr:hypothetical protein MARU1_003604 [Malassezia arunalokei]
MSSPYAFKPGGALKLKGDKSKKKKKSSASAKPPHEILAADKSSSTKYATTKAEQKFEEVQRKRQLREQARTEAHKSHKDKVDSFNAYLDSLSEHHDMPKIGPG